MKQRKFEYRRGRNNRIYLKQGQKTVFDYVSDDDEIADYYNKTSQKPVQKPVFQEMLTSFDHKVDKDLYKQKNFIHDISTHIKNKRQRKKVLKMENIRLMSNGMKQPIETNLFTNASSEEKGIGARNIQDPAIES